MAYQVVICAVGIYFVEDVFHFLKKYSCSLHEACMRCLNTKHKSAIVRKVGSYLTWIHAPRLHIALRDELKDTSAYGDSNSTLKCNCLCDTSAEGPKSSVQLENRIEELEKELLQLQAQVSSILFKTESIKNPKFDSEIDDNVVSSSSATQASLPPLPPPPPPPLPPAPLVQTRTLVVKVKPKCTKVVEKDSTATIVEELSKRPPKLRHVERSPGGRPVRNTPIPSDPADILAAVLRKRFEAIHGEKQECYTLSPESSPKTVMITGH